MAHDVLMYWKWGDNDFTSREQVRYAYRRDFGRVRDGDTIWIVTIEHNGRRLTGRLLLVGRLVNVKITDRAGAERLLGTTSLRPSKDYTGCYLVASNAIAKRDLISVAHLAPQLRFHGKPDHLEVDNAGCVKAQQFQSLRYLKSDSVELLQAAWEGRALKG